MTSHVNRHKGSDKIHKVAERCLLLRECMHIHGWHALTNTNSDCVCRTGSTHLSGRRRYRGPSVHVAQHGRHFHALHSLLHASHITTQGVRIWLSSNHWAEAVLCGWRELQRLVQFHAAASFGRRRCPMGTGQWLGALLLNLFCAENLQSVVIIIVFNIIITIILLIFIMIIIIIILLVCAKNLG